MIVLQHIATIWTKRSRGMPGAAKRNAVPRALAIPLVNGESPDRLFVHRVEVLERDGFALHQRGAAWTDARRYRSFDIESGEDVIRVFFSYSPKEYGQPGRGNYRHLLFQLKRGQTGAFHINGRFSWGEGHWYSQHFFNIAHVSAIRSDLFTAAAPDCSIDWMADLF